MHVLSTLFLSAIFMGGVSHAQADVRIELNFTWVMTPADGGPVIRNHEHAAYLLHGGNKVSRMFNDTFHEGKAGGLVRLDTQHASHIRFKNGTIDEIVPFSTHIFRTVIRTNGSTTCEAEKTVRLKAGQTLYKDWAQGTPVVATEMHAEDVSCAIAEE